MRWQLQRLEKDLLSIGGNLLNKRNYPTKSAIIKLLVNFSIKFILNMIIYFQNTGVESVNKTSERWLEPDIPGSAGVLNFEKDSPVCRRFCVTFVILWPCISSSSLSLSPSIRFLYAHFWPCFLDAFWTWLKDTYSTFHLLTNRTGQ